MTNLLRRWAVPALLVVVAVAQICRVRGYDLTPWKGGGFGMFSSVDTLDARFVSFHVETSTDVVPVEPPSHMAKDILRVRAMPSQDGLNRIARRLAGHIWLKSDGQSKTPAIVPLERGQGDPLPDEVAPVKSVRVELWRQTFNAEKVRIEAKHLLTSKVAVSNEAQ